MTKEEKIQELNKKIVDQFTVFENEIKKHKNDPYYSFILRLVYDFYLSGSTDKENILYIFFREINSPSDPMFLNDIRRFLANVLIDDSSYSIKWEEEDKDNNICFYEESLLLREDGIPSFVWGSDQCGTSSITLFLNVISNYLKKQKRRYEKAIEFFNLQEYWYSLSNIEFSTSKKEFNDKEIEKAKKHIKEYEYWILEIKSLLR